jgi:Alginate export
MDRMPKQHEAAKGDDALKPTHFREYKMTRALLTIALLSTATPAFADAVKIKPLIDTRLRYENVDQKPFAREASAITARIRAGFEAKKGDFAILVEGEGTLAISEKYNSGVNGKGAFPVVADPQTIELNRAQIQYTGIPKAVVTVGRQRINLDDQRFVGNVGFRDNEQTFDAARIEYSGIKNVKADVTYSWSQRTIWGVDGFGARQQAVSGDNVFANLSYKHKIGTLTGFAYFVDQDEAAISGFRMSSKTFGARFAGSAPLSKKAKLSYLASYARQSDFHHNPNNYSADYIAAELGVEAKGFKLLGGYELLGSDKGIALTSFQTPYATLHKFNGWTDKFLVTPPNGLQDIYGTLGYTKPKVGPFASIALSANYHDYKSDRLGLHYGTEFGAQIAAKLKKYTFTLKYADYNAKAFATDTRKIWASVEWAL